MIVTTPNTLHSIGVDIIGCDAVGAGFSTIAVVVVVVSAVVVPFVLFVVGTGLLLVVAIGFGSSGVGSSTCGSSGITLKVRLTGTSLETNCRYCWGTDRF
jgi:hypothetical protein